MKGCLGKWIIEQWTGKADIKTRAFRLNAIGEEPVKSTICFKNEDGTDKIPLPRAVLAGEYQMVLSPDGESVTAVHASWVEFAHLRPEAAAGLLFRLDSDTAMCPMLQKGNASQVNAQIKDATDLLRNSVVSKTDVPAIVNCALKLASVSNISTTGETFDAELTVEYDYLLTREDVFRYMMHIPGMEWKPSWIPDQFRLLNATESEADVHMLPPQVRVTNNSADEKELSALVTWQVRAQFVEAFELQHYPFDVQHFHVQMECEQPEGVKMMIKLHDDCEGGAAQSPNWPNSAWQLLHTSLNAGRISYGKQTSVSVFLSAKAIRNSMACVVRIMVVLAMMLILSLSIFTLSLGETANRMANGFTLLLTVTAYSLVIGDSLPSLGYLTFLDKFTLFGYCYITLVIIQTTIIGLKGEDAPQLFSGIFGAAGGGDSTGSTSWGEEPVQGVLNRVCLILDSAIIVGVLLCMVIWIKCHINPSEMKKTPDPAPAAHPIDCVVIEYLGKSSAAAFKGSSKEAERADAVSETAPMQPLPPNSLAPLAESPKVLEADAAGETAQKLPVDATEVHPPPCASCPQLCLFLFC